MASKGALAITATELALRIGTGDIKLVETETTLRIQTNGKEYSPSMHGQDVLCRLRDGINVTGNWKVHFYYKGEVTATPEGDNDMAQKPATRKISVDLTHETIRYLDHCKARGEFGSRSRVLENVLPQALRDWEERKDEETDEITEQEETTIAETTPQFITDRERTITPTDDDPAKYGGYAIGDSVTMFFQNPQNGIIARIWKTSKGHRLVIVFDNGAYGIYKPIDVDKARNAAKERRRIEERKAERHAA